MTCNETDHSVRDDRPPARKGTVRPESTWEMDPDNEAWMFAEPEHKSGRRGYR